MMILFGKDHLFLTEDDSVACQKNVDFQFYEFFFRRYSMYACLCGWMSMSFSPVSNRSHAHTINCDALH